MVDCFTFTGCFLELMTLWCMDTFRIPKALGCVASMPTQKSAHRQDTVAVMKWIFDGLQL